MSKFIFAAINRNIDLNPREKLELELAIIPLIKYYENKINIYKQVGTCAGLIIHFNESIRVLRNLLKKLNE